MKKKIVIIIDHPYRELDYLILLAYKLKKNLEVYIVEQYHWYITFLINPEYVIMPHTRDNMSIFADLCKEKDIKIFILETEGGVKISSHKTPKFQKRLVKTLNISERFFCWGTDTYNKLKKYDKLNKLVLSGIPKTDFLYNKKLKPFYPIFKNKCNLFITNFNIINTKASRLEKNLAELSATKEHRNKLTEVLTSTQLKYLKLIEATVKKYKNEKFILKTHPFENELFYIDYFKKFNFKNLKIMYKGEIFNYIRKCKNLIHYNCQTAIEAYLCNIQPISISYLLSNYEKEWSNYDLESISYIPKNTKDFMQRIKKSVRVKANKKIQEKYFLNPKTKMSSDLIAETIFNQIEKKQKKNISLFELTKIIGTYKINKNNEFHKFYYGIKKLIIILLSKINPFRKKKNERSKF